MSFSATRRWTGSVCSAIQTVAHAALADLLEQLVAGRSIVPAPSAADWSIVAVSAPALIP